MHSFFFETPYLNVAIILFTMFMCKNYSIPIEDLKSARVCRTKPAPPPTPGWPAFLEKPGTHRRLVALSKNVSPREMQAGEIERSEGGKGDIVLKIPGGKLFREFGECYHESNLSSVGRTLRSA